ncbi:MAG: hypothetical protein LC774_13085 [Acidobacteria bacterium]|nr:hypothetical protein [Acidobacteriota bacterium]
MTEPSFDSVSLDFFDCASSARTRSSSGGCSVCGFFAAAPPDCEQLVEQSGLFGDRGAQPPDLLPLLAQLAAHGFERGVARVRDRVRRRTRCRRGVVRGGRGRLRASGETEGEGEGCEREGAREEVRHDDSFFSVGWKVYSSAARDILARRARPDAENFGSRIGRA